MRSDELLTIRQTPPIDTSCSSRGFLQRSEEGACPQDKGVWGFWHRVGDHIRLGKGFDDIAIAPGTRDPHKHIHTDSMVTLIKNFIRSLIKRDLDIHR